MFAAVAASSTASQQSPRAMALRALGETVGTLPFDAKAAQEALKAVKEEGGEELVMEAIATIAAFECTTRVADATCRKPFPDHMLFIVKSVNMIMMQKRRVLVGLAVLVVSIIVNKSGGGRTTGTAV